MLIPIAGEGADDDADTAARFDAADDDVDADLSVLPVRMDCRLPVRSNFFGGGAVEDEEDDVDEEERARLRFGLLILPSLEDCDCECEDCNCLRLELGCRIPSSSSS